MNNIQSTHFVAGAAIIVLAGLAFYFYTPNSNLSDIEPEQTATTTEQDIATTTEEGPETDAQTPNEVGSGKAKLELTFESAPTPQSGPTVILGPRKKATSPTEALEFFAEALAAQNVERAVSYFRKDVQEGYRTAFTTRYKDEQHPVVTAYYDGDVKEVELLDPSYGLYEIRVHPKNSPRGYTVNFVYDNSVGEFVILEL